MNFKNGCRVHLRGETQVGIIIDVRENDKGVMEHEIHWGTSNMQMVTSWVPTSKLVKSKDKVWSGDPETGKRGLAYDPKDYR